MKTTTSRWTTIVVLNVLAWSLFGGFRMCTAQSKGGRVPFPDGGEQRLEILNELSEIKELIREQNTILRDSGVKNAAKR